MTHEQIVNLIVFPVVDEFRDSMMHPERFNKSPALKLFGCDGVLDSVDFVSFLLAVETRAQELCAHPVRLMDEKAFSQEKNPFADVAGLCAYIEKLVNEP